MSKQEYLRLFGEGGRARFEFGIFVFALTLVITRLFAVQMTKATKKIVELMANHGTVRNFIVNHF